ncbi:MAG: hypothetical protein H0V79_02105 [Actinobacteria bacterium]|nr:hypothetical protein [Actinomycetota bacterium]
MIVAMHIASGAAAGALVRSPTAAALVGATLHFFGDRVPHEDVASKRFEIWCGVAGVFVLAATRGPLDPATVGAVASAAPDLEHVVRLPRPGGRKLFPSHRIPGWHRPGGISAEAQLFLAGALFGAVFAAGFRR